MSAVTPIVIERGVSSAGAAHPAAIVRAAVATTAVANLVCDLMKLLRLIGVANLEISISDGNG
jgi:hypothetical protein